MATTFTITPSGKALFALQPLTFTLTLDATAASIVNFMLSDGGAGGTFSSVTGIGIGLLTTTFTYKAAAGASGLITITAAASGGLVLTQTSILPVNYLVQGVSAGQIIAQALGILGVKAAGETVQGIELDDMLDLLNGSILDSWRTQSLYASGVQTITGILKANAKSMTIGPTGDLATPNVPIQLEDGCFFTSGNGDYPMDTATSSEYRGIFYKTLSTLGPDKVYYDNGTPNGTLYFYPQAAGDTPISLQVLVQLSAFADAATQYQLQPGVRRALAYSLAEEAQAYYQRELSPSSQRQCGLAKRDLQRTNHVTPVFQSFRAQNRNILSGWER